MRLPSPRRRLGRRSPARWTGHVSVAVLVLVAWAVSGVLTSRADMGIGREPEPATGAPVAELRIADPPTAGPTPLATPYPLRPGGPLPGPSEPATGTSGSVADDGTGQRSGSTGTGSTSDETGPSTAAPSVGATSGGVTATAGPTQTPAPTATPLVCTDPLLSPLPSACVEDPLP